MALYNSTILSKAIKFLTSKISIAFFLLKQAFTKVSILQHFDLEFYIRIETNTLGFAINKVLSQQKLHSS